MCVCVFVFVFVFICGMCVLVCVCMCIWVHRCQSRMSDVLFITLHLETEFLIESGGKLGPVTPSKPSVSIPHRAGVIATCGHAQLLMWMLEV